MFNTINATAFKYQVKHQQNTPEIHPSRTILVVRVETRTFESMTQKVSPWVLLSRTQFFQKRAREVNTANTVKIAPDLTDIIKQIIVSQEQGKSKQFAKVNTVNPVKITPDLTDIIKRPIVSQEQGRSKQFSRVNTVNPVKITPDLAHIMNRVIAPLKQSGGKKLAEFSTNFDRGIDSLGKYSIGMHTKNIFIEGFSDPGQQMKIKALASGNMFFDTKNSEKKSSVMTFSLSKQAGDFRSELFHLNHLGMNVESHYSFNITFNSLPEDLIFFQVRETGRGMRKYGRDRPPLSLHIKKDGIVMAVINKINSPSEKRKLVKLPFDTNVKFSVRIVWNRENPAIDVNLNDKSLMRYRESFGAPNSKFHYNKFGAYVPNQKNSDGIKESKVQFDNFKQIHWEFPSAVPETGYTHVVGDRSGNDNVNSLGEAMSAFPSARDDLGLSGSPIASKQMVGQLISAVVQNQLH